MYYGRRFTKKSVEKRIKFLEEQLIELRQKEGKPVAGPRTKICWNKRQQNKIVKDIENLKQLLVTKEEEKIEKAKSLVEGTKATVVTQDKLAEVMKLGIKIHENAKNYDKLKKSDLIVEAKKDIQSLLEALDTMISNSIDTTLYE